LIALQLLILQLTARLLVYWLVGSVMAWQLFCLAAWLLGCLTAFMSEIIHIVTFAISKSLKSAYVQDNE
jgi:hypothetical protein